MAVAGLIDASVHQHWDDDRTLLEYVSPGWRDYLEQSMDLPGGAPMPFIPGVMQLAPGDVRARTPQAASLYGGAETVDDAALAASEADRVVLSHGLGSLTPVLTNPNLAEEIARAINDWTIERWLTAPPSGATPSSWCPISRRTTRGRDATSAAPEDRRRPARRQRARATVRAPDLPPDLRRGRRIRSAHRGPRERRRRRDAEQPTAGGLPTTFVESYVLGSQSLAAAVASFIGQGVFERFPDFKLFVEGAGCRLAALADVALRRPSGRPRAAKSPGSSTSRPSTCGATSASPPTRSSAAAISRAGAA